MVLMKTLETGLHVQFEQTMSRKKFKADDVEAGRKYIEAYVKYIHYVERLYEAAKTSAPATFRKRQRNTPIEVARERRFQ